VRRLLATSFSALLGVSAFVVVASAATPAASQSARAHDPAVVAQARAAFDKYMSSHAPRVSGGGWVSPGSTLPSAAHPVSGTVTSMPSLNWSGFADTSSTSTADDFSYVSGSWTMPNVTCPRAPYQNQGTYISNWVGIDGFSDATVEQLGTGVQCFEGVEYYYVWYEMFPNGTVQEGPQACIVSNVDCPQPGDRISASVAVTPGSAGENNYTLSLTDRTRPQESFSVTAPCATTGSNACTDSSAEWVVERPAYEPIPGLFQFVPQAYYGQTGFSSGALVANGRLSSVGRFQGAVYSMPMVDDSISYYLACPGQQAPVGSVLLFTAANCPAATPSFFGGFSVSWDSSF
jgi:hypothetical protein